MSDDITTLEMTNGSLLDVELWEDVREVRFLNEACNVIYTISYDSLATVTGPLSLDFGAGVFLDAVTVKHIQQWANLDASGLRQRAAL